MFQFLDRQLAIKPTAVVHLLWQQQI